MKKKVRVGRRPLRFSGKLKSVSTKRTNITKRLKSPSTKISKHRIKRSRSPSRLSADYTVGKNEGAAWRGSGAIDTSQERFREIVHRHWNRRFNQTSRNKKMDWNQTYLRGKNYAAGFMQGARMYASLTPVPLRSRAAAIVCVSSDSSDLHRVLSQLEALPLHEIVLVLSQPTDGIFALARSRKNTLIVHLPDSVEPDVGRALGAKLTDADTLLFVDGKQATDANVLARFLWECDGRMDIALNDISARMGLFKQRGGIEQFHEFLNSSLNRQDLRANSMSVLPIAMSRHALDTLGSAVLAVPVKAHAIAILNKLRIGAGGSAGSGTLKEQSKSKEHLKKAAGDHVEALKEAMTTRGSRLQFVDTIRNRSVLGDER